MELLLYSQSNFLICLHHRPCTLFAQCLNRLQPAKENFISFHHFCAADLLLPSVSLSHIILIVHLSSWIVTIQERDTEGKSKSAAQKWWKEMKFSFAGCSRLRHCANSMHGLWWRHIRKLLCEYKSSSIHVFIVYN